MLQITWNEESKLNPEPSLHHLVNIPKFVYHLTKKRFFCTYLLNCANFKHYVSNVYKFESIFIIKNWNTTENLLFNHFLLSSLSNKIIHSPLLQCDWIQHMKIYSKKQCHTKGHYLLNLRNKVIKSEWHRNKKFITGSKGKSNKSFNNI